MISIREWLPTRQEHYHGAGWAALSKALLPVPGRSTEKSPEVGWTIHGEHAADMDEGLRMPHGGPVWDYKG